ncbi:MAG: enoyl-CoA hydratase/isomerase family protein [candidate division Zixibacteria bacterium]|nr:enoyl-CoA hydratase/isomerase family protein [candidate division Zixibacteria bacterium]
MDFKNLIVEIKDGVAVITISREKALNALNKDVISELHKFFSTHWMEKDFRCVVITGAGKAFVAGADIGELSELDSPGACRTAEIGQYVMKSIENFPCPVIAAINGFALGGGCELAMACDIRIASEKAKLGQPEVNLGIIPGYGGTQRLSRLVGKGMAKKLIFTGDMIGAAEALRIGLVDEVHPVDELMDKVMDLAKKIASKSAPSLKLAKEAINRGLDVNLSVGCDLEKGAFAVNFGYADAKEGLKAFMEKRAPKFKHK